MTDHDDDHGSEKPVGALIMAMQAIGRALEHWRTGELIEEKKQKFSADNYGDIVVKAKKSDGTMTNGKRTTRIRRATVFVRTLRSLTDAQWDQLIVDARQHFFTEKNQSRIRSTSTATLVEEEEEEEDPDGDFVMMLA